MKKTHDEKLGLMAKELLVQLGNKRPTQKQQKMMLLLLSKVTVIDSLFMSNVLTGREISCLYLAAMGKTSRESAELLNIKRYTVDQYHKQIKQKLGCKTLAEAVFTGFRLGYFAKKESISV